MHSPVGPRQRENKARNAPACPWKIMLKGQAGFAPASNERNSENHTLQPGQINNASGICFICREEFVMYPYVLLAMGVQCVTQHLGQSLLLLQLNKLLM